MAKTNTLNLTNTALNALIKELEYLSADNDILDPDCYTAIPDLYKQLKALKNKNRSPDWVLKILDENYDTIQKKIFATKQEIIRYITANIRHLVRFHVFNGSQKYFWVDSARKLIKAN